MLTTVTFRGFSVSVRRFHYVQGQISLSNVREYFYYIDHRGQLFLDDAKIKNFTTCFKDKKFLKFFYTHLKLNVAGKYGKLFPFISPCGPEMNFIRCNSLPIVYNKIISQTADLSSDLLLYAGEQLSQSFVPSKLFVESVSGRLYHPGPNICGGVGLVASDLAQEISDKFIFESLKGNSQAHMQVTDVFNHSLISNNDLSYHCTFQMLIFI
ncbi:hypothetical protein HELRODRAFT_85834 [Helobdella robusta]|uniref:Uncharacterized protein n=1 Tax=Helobdella robusta TaxID=6412 RepID=T1G631_HELRO|nr:hypothetical protein HELRODRAFT_85834 [Helobdella robusta]ESN97042.1 hypothetical protein HELRODRAFT_85834 [Helobdella robusta]